MGSTYSKSKEIIVKYIKILFDDDLHYCIKPEDIGDAISAEIESLTDEICKTITLSLIEMSEEEYSKLPEFEG